ncbi:monooxygenase [Actinoplanes sp. NPDC089786]|uniref:monooxygenase n=1 Tax=Actinoplanes sp. NPDC089786 TaxID=3155185 RepID=UPI003426E343
MSVSLHVWRVPRRRLGAAFLRMALDPRRVRALPGVTFAKFLGTGTGVSFGPFDADLTRFAALVVSREAVPLPSWDRICSSSAVVDLVPLHSVGTWSGRKPFAAAPDKPDGLVLALTRARLRPSRALTFWQAVPPVVAALDRAPGLLARFGVGEAPIGWQGTVSVWRGAAELRDFAYRQPEHRAVIDRTPTDNWYAEDLFARFAVRGITGDRDLLGWVNENKNEYEKGRAQR